MSESDIERIRAAQEELRRQVEESKKQLWALQQEEQAALRAEAERKRQEDLKREIKIHFDEFIARRNEVQFKLSFKNAEQSSISPDLSAVLRPFYFTGMHTTDKFNYVGPIRDYQSLRDRIAEKLNAEVTFKTGVLESITEELNAPNWRITKSTKYIEIKPRYDVGVNILYQHIPGLKSDTNRNMMLAPLTEVQKVWEYFGEMPLETCDFSQEARDFILKQLETKLQLENIIALKDAPEIQIQLANGAEPFKFQRVGVKFLQYANGLGIVADEMGLGKTLTALIYDMLCEDHTMTVVVCPAMLKTNWCREINKYTGHVAYPLQGSIPDKTDILNLATKRPRYVVLNYDILGRKSKRYFEGGATVDFFPWVELLNMLKPNLLIVDEGHYIKNVESQRSQAVRDLKADKIIFLTGTPVLNRPGELWPMLTMVAPDLFPFRESFINQYTYDGVRARNAGELREILKGIMIRRLKKDVLVELPPIRRINEYVELSPKAAERYNLILKGIYETIATYNPQGIGGNREQITSILAMITRLKQVCADDTTTFTADLVTNIADSAENGSGKCLIFSQYKGAAYNIYQKLQDQGALCFVKRTPSDFVTVDTDERYMLVDQFQNDPKVKFLIVTEKTTREGMNITAAENVIFNDLFWTPAAHQQAEARAYGRLSNLHSVNSYYVISECDITNWIWELLGLKQSVIDVVVEGKGVESQSDETIVKQLIERIKNKMGI